ncbi:hypothetical protein PUV54_15375 [Hyphococcus flavus]|uniref:Uncharacterized protein n=1 Tax=Hyphococcus flavus TaxID=1866326 RepID=A0AAE9ZB46_9PROT|nr:hypothetical protein [Hyphococcus flavus]WDI31329.1 hypothetical protein PUV54_15375 [Hyphococcus flavus]
MTGNLLLDSLVSLGAIGLMVLLAWVMFRAPLKPVTEEEAAERLRFDEPDFKPVSWLIDEKGRAAFAEGEDGDYALVSRLGVDLVTRRYPAIAVNAAEEGGALVLKPLDPGSSTVRLHTADAATWARKFS